MPSKKPTDPGQYNRRFEVQQPLEGPANATGERPVTWISQGMRWGKFAAQGGRELSSAQEVSPQITHVVTMRFFRGLGPRWRLVYQGRVLNISWADNGTEEDVEHIVNCVEAVDKNLPMADFTLPASSWMLAIA